MSATQERDPVSRTRRMALETLGDAIEPVSKVFREVFPRTAENPCGRRDAVTAFSVKYQLAQRLGETQLDPFGYAM
jgi:hypothetical protein